MILAINYTLFKKGQNYDLLHEKIKSFGTYCHISDSCWLIETSSTPLEVANYLLEGDAIDKNDLLFVSTLARGAAYFNISPACERWISARLG